MPPAVSGQERGNLAESQSRPEPALATEFNWRELESSDYAAYIANLRRVGCPDRTVREIITADVADLYAQKRQELGLGQGGLWTGRWSRDEQAATLAALFGESCDRSPGSKPPSDTAAPLPLVFQRKAFDSLSLNEEQKADLE
jgi:hypothetical protein